MLENAIYLSNLRDRVLAKALVPFPMLTREELRNIRRLFLDKLEENPTDEHTREPSSLMSETQADEKTTARARLMSSPHMNESDFITIMEKMGLERRTKANDDANAGNHVTAMAGATVDETKTKEAHVNALDAQETREHQLRKSKNKKDMELHNFIGKYDKDLGDLEG